MQHGLPEPTNAAYGLAKLNALIGAQAYAQERGLLAANLIPVNMYGRHDHFDLENSHVIPAMIRKIHEAKVNGVPATMWGDGTPTREFLHVDDFSQACLKACEILDHNVQLASHFINVGTGEEISMKDLAEAIADCVGYDGEILWDKGKPNGQLRRCLDIRNARAYLSYEPKVKFIDGLRDTIDWYIHGCKEEKNNEVSSNR
jgi:GDP-L-fucose synthase